MSDVIDEKDYPQKAQDWRPALIAKKEDAVAFIGWTTLSEGNVLDVDVGFIAEDGKPDHRREVDGEMLYHYDLKTAKVLDKCMMKATKVLASEGFDVFEAVQHMVAMMMLEAQYPMGLTLFPEIAEDRDTPKKQAKRREQILAQTVVHALTQTGIAVESDDGSGIAFPQGMLPPEIERLLEKHMGAEQQVARVGEDGDIEKAIRESINKKTQNPKSAEEYFGVDIDGDDNDDDPFADFDFGGEEE